MHRTIFLIAALTLFGASGLQAATFTATAEGDTVTVYSTSTKPEVCAAVANYTYLANGKRENGWTSCGAQLTKPGKNVKVCSFTNAQIIAPLIKNVRVECPPKR